MRPFPESRGGFIKGAVISGGWSEETKKWGFEVERRWLGGLI